MIEERNEILAADHDDWCVSDRGIREECVFPIEERTIPSPDGRYEACLQPVGKSAWEAMSASLRMNDFLFGVRHFDWQGVWSPCSRYFAIMEWTSDTTPKIPAACLILIDIHEERESTIDCVESGFVEPLRIHNDTLRYVKIDLKSNTRNVLEQFIETRRVWTAVRSGRRGTEGNG